MTRAQYILSQLTESSNVSSFTDIVNLLWWYKDDERIAELLDKYHYTTKNQLNKDTFFSVKELGGVILQFLVDKSDTLLPKEEQFLVNVTKVLQARNIHVTPPPPPKKVTIAPTRTQHNGFTIDPDTSPEDVLVLIGPDKRRHEYPAAGVALDNPNVTKYLTEPVSEDDFEHLAEWVTDQAYSTEERVRMNILVDMCRRLYKQKFGLSQ